MLTSMLDILACPRCRHMLRVMDAHTGLLCPRCRMVYPIRDEVPFLAREEAVPLSAWKYGERASEPDMPHGAFRPAP